MSQPNINMCAPHSLLRDPGFFHLVVLPSSRTSEASRGSSASSRQMKEATNHSKMVLGVCLKVVYKIYAHISLAKTQSHDFT